METEAPSPKPSHRDGPVVRSAVRILPTTQPGVALLDPVGRAGGIVYPLCRLRAGRPHLGAPRGGGLHGRAGRLWSRPPAGNADRQHRRLGAKGARLWRPERRGLGRGGRRSSSFRGGPLDSGGGEGGRSGNAGGSSRRFPRGAGAVRGSSGSLPGRRTHLEGGEAAGRDPSGRFPANGPRFFGGFLDHRNNLAKPFRIADLDRVLGEVTGAAARPM